MIDIERFEKTARMIDELLGQGHTMQTIADICGVSRVTVWRWQNGSGAPTEDRMGALEGIQRVKCQSGENVYNPAHADRKTNQIP